MQYCSFLFSSYIEFYDAMSVPMAIALSGQPLLGQPVMVKPSEAEKNLVQSTTAVASGGLIGPYTGGARRLYIGNLHFNITEDQLRQVSTFYVTVYFDTDLSRTCSPHQMLCFFVFRLARYIKLSRELYVNMEKLFVCIPVFMNLCL